MNGYTLSFKKHLGFASLLILASLICPQEGWAMDVDPPKDPVQQAKDKKEQASKKRKREEGERGEESQEPDTKRARRETENPPTEPSSSASSMSTEDAFPSSSSASAAPTTQTPPQNTASAIGIVTTAAPTMTRQHIEDLIARAKNKDVTAQDTLMEIFCFLDFLPPSSKRRELFTPLGLDISNWEGGDPMSSRFVNNPYYTYYSINHGLYRSDLNSEEFFNELQKRSYQGHLHSLHQINLGSLSRMIPDHQSEMAFEYWKRAASVQSLENNQKKISALAHAKLARYISDIKLSWEHRKLAVAQGYNDPELASFVGMVIESKRFSEDEKRESWALLKKQAETNPHVYKQLGRLCEDVKKDNEKALKYFIKGAQQEDFAVCFDEIMRLGYGSYRMSPPNFKIAVKAFKAAAGRDRNQAKAILAQMYFDGEGVKKDYAEALKYVSEISQSHKTWGFVDYVAEIPLFSAKTSPGRLYMLGFLHEHTDPVKAMTFYQKAMNIGFVPAENAFDSFLKHIAENYEKYLTRPHPRADSLLAKIAHTSGLSGTGLSQPTSDDPFTTRCDCPHLLCIHEKRQTRFLHLLADRGWAEAQYLIGELYLKGSRILPDSRKALHYFKLASDDGILKASLAAMKLYADPESELFDFKAAQRYSKRAAKQGHVESLVQWTDRYLAGENPIKAAKYCFLSVKAITALLRMNNTQENRALYQPKGRLYFDTVMELQKKYRILADQNDRAVQYIKGSINYYGATLFHPVHNNPGFNTAIEYLTLVADDKDGNTQEGKAYHKLAKLYLRIAPIDFVKGISYGTFALKKGNWTALNTLAELYKKQDTDRQMAASYYYQSVCKGLSHPKVLRPYFVFQKSSNQGMLLNQPINLEEFSAKTVSLTLHLEPEVMIHSVAQMGDFKLHKNGALVIPELEPLYQQLIDFGLTLEQLAGDFVQAEEKDSSLAGFLVRCVKPTPHLLEKSSEDLEGEQKGFCRLTLDGEEFACLGGRNPEKGHKFKQLIDKKQREANESITKIRSILEQKLVLLEQNLLRQDLMEEHRTQINGHRNQINGELEKLPAASQAIEEGLNELKNWVKTRAHLRDQAFEDKYEGFFKN